MADFNNFRKIIKELRGENGCSWDKKQTFSSLLKYLIEESYEYIDAVNENDKDKMCDELGDILLQVMLHSQIAEEKNLFTIDDVIENVSNKMIKRHPHVFGDVSDNSQEGILDRWEEIKKSEKGDEYSLKSVGKHLPATLRTALIVEKAKKMYKNQIILSKNLDKIRKMLDNNIDGENIEKLENKTLSEILILIIELFVLKGSNLEIELNREIENYISKFEDKPENQEEVLL